MSCLVPGPQHKSVSVRFVVTDLLHSGGASVSLSTWKSVNTELLPTACPQWSKDSVGRVCRATSLLRCGPGA